MVSNKDSLKTTRGSRHPSPIPQGWVCLNSGQLTPATPAPNLFNIRTLLFNRNDTYYYIQIHIFILNKVVVKKSGKIYN